MEKVKIAVMSLENETRKSEFETELLVEESSEGMGVINLYPQKTYQSIDGFGGAMTEAAGYVLSEMDAASRKDVLEAYYGKEGIGYTLARVPIDSCDFGLGQYCAEEDPEDTAFEKLSFARDARYIEPVISDVMEITGKTLHLMLSPWSPPAFMKTTGIRIGGGHLRKEMYRPYADYLVKYISEYIKRGFPVEAMTVQNEPLAAQTWDSCIYTAQEEKAFLKEALYPALCAAGLQDIRIYVWDHNKELLYERTKDLMDEETGKIIAGVAFHWYSGDHFDTLKMVREDYPQLKLSHSEGCVDSTVTKEGIHNDGENARRYAHDIINDFNGGMNSWIDWNLVLETNGGPNYVDNLCSAPVLYDVEKKEVNYMPVFHAIAQFSRYIQPGAVRIGSSVFSSTLETTSFQNPDGSVVAVVMNPGTELNAELRIEGKHATLKLCANSISTIRIDA